MRAVAARARRDVRVALRELLAVHARRVFGRLIDALLRREPAHEAGVAVAAGARLDDLRWPGGLPLNPRAGVVRARLVGGRGIAAVAIDAREPALAMDVGAGRRAAAGAASARLRQPSHDM